MIEWYGWYWFDRAFDCISFIQIGDIGYLDLDFLQYLCNLIKDINGDIWVLVYGNLLVIVIFDGYLLCYCFLDGSVWVFKNKYCIEVLLLDKYGMFYIVLIGIL